MQGKVTAVVLFDSLCPSESEVASPLATLDGYGHTLAVTREYQELGVPACGFQVIYARGARGVGDAAAALGSPRKGIGNNGKLVAHWVLPIRSDQLSMRSAWRRVQGATEACRG